MRDIENDAASGKKTLVVRVGINKAKRYHMFLILSAVIFMVTFICLHYSSPWHWLFLLAIPLLLMQVKNIVKEQPPGMDKYLKQLSLTTLLMVICIAVSIIINPYA